MGLAERSDEVDASEDGAAAADVERPRRRRAPSQTQIARWLDEGGARATDGCWVEPDGRCKHGARSWLIVLGMV